MAFDLSSYGPEFIFSEGEPYDGDSMPSDEPTSVWQAINSMNKKEWESAAREVSGVDAQYLTPETVLDKIRETDTVDEFASRVEVYIDKDGYHTVSVYKEDNPRRKANRSRTSNPGPTLTAKDMKRGTLIVSKADPQWGSWGVLGPAKGVPGAWEIRGRSGTRILNEGEFRFWAVAPKCNPVRKRPARRKKKRNPTDWTPIGGIGDLNPIEHGGGIVYETPYGNEMLYFQESEDTVYVHRVDINDDVLSDLDWVDWEDVSSFVDTPVADLKKAARAKDPLGRAQVYEAAASYHGWSNLDSDPTIMTLAEAERTFGEDADAAAEAGRKRNPGCSKTKLLVKRKGYTRADGTRVAPTSFCIRDRGKKGRGPDIVPDLREGKLGGAGYTDKKTAARRLILTRCVKQYGYRSCLGSLQYLMIVGKREWPKTKLAKVESDKNWLMKSYGGPGSFGPEDNPRRRRLANRLSNP